MIFKRMREQILDKAIRGLLVPQIQAEGIVEQIGDPPSEIPFAVPESWKWVQLVNTCVYIQRGRSPKYSEIQEIPVIAQKCNQWDGLHLEKAKFIDPQTADKYTQERWLQDNDLMWNSTGLGSIGRVAIYKECLNPYKKAVVDSHVTVIRTDNKILEPRYLYYYIFSKTVQGVIENRSDGTTKQKELATSTVQAYEIPLPPINEQRRIADKIDSLFCEIGRAEKAYEELQSLASVLRGQILQKAIQGKLVPQLPEEGVVEQIGEVPAEVPFDIPDSWKWFKLPDFVSFNIGKTPDRSNSSYWDGDIPWVSIADITKSDGYIRNTKELISHCALEDKFSNKLAKAGSLLMSFKLSIGKVAFLSIDAAHNEAIISINPHNDSEDTKKFLFYALPILVTYAETNNAIKGKTLNKNKLKALLIPVPPVAEQKRIVAKLETLLKQVDLMIK